MAYLLITRDDGTVTWRERLVPEDFDSDHFRTCLAERIGWGVADAAEREESDADPQPSAA